MAETKTATEKVAKEKTVKIILPLTRTEKNDVPVGVNGKTWLIKRGVEVEVPRYVATALREREQMLETIMLFNDAKASK